jgi:hypothetical protein
MRSENSKLNHKYALNAVPQRNKFFAGPTGRAIRGIGHDRLDAETVGSNPA